MKSFKFFLLNLFLIAIISGHIFSQTNIEYLGIPGQEVTSISVYLGVITVGTDHHGAYWRTLDPTTNWTLIGLDTINVRSVYAHSGVGPTPWVITAGVEPNPGSQNFIYCSIAGNPFFTNSQGIHDSLTSFISDLDGFQSESICGETFAAGGRALYRRGLNDTIWSAVYTTTIEGNFETVETHDDYPGVVLAGGEEGFAGILLLKSLNYGDTWEDISPLTMVLDVDFAGDSAQTIFVATGQNVFRSLDAGQTWGDVFGGGGWFWISRVIFIPPTTVYIAGGNGLDSSSAILFRSDDLGVNWQEITLWMAGPIVDMDSDQSGWVYFATRHNGVYRFQDIPVGLDDPPRNYLPTSSQLFQNYPNPFNPKTVISYQLATGSDTELKIYNLLGQHIRTLVSTTQPEGSHQVEWDGKDDFGKDVASGVYVYQIKSNNFIDSRKMLLIR